MTTTQHNNQKRIDALIQKGVNIPDPGSVFIAQEVLLSQISPDGVTLHPGCRIRGATTCIGSGCTLGEQDAVTVDACQLGRQVSLKGGYYKQSVFLDHSNVGSGAQVREACLLEEEASCAHSVGLKQTILFPFVTLGSLINFCDVLMAGGTSRKDHSEVGSSYVHFNFTPDSDKATASLVGEVPRGVMLDQNRIFLGGQGGLVGPARIGYGNVVAAGCVQRGDIREENRLVIPNTPRGGSLPFSKGMVPGYRRILEANLEFIANLHALSLWYRFVRKPFFDTWPLGTMVYRGALDVLSAACQERCKRLAAFLYTLSESSQDDQRRSLALNREQIVAVLLKPDIEEVAVAQRDRFLKAIENKRAQQVNDYIKAIKDLDLQEKKTGTDWLRQVVAACMKTVRSFCCGTAFEK